VMTVVMISHMFLNLKRSNHPAQEEDENYDMPVGSLMEREKTYQTSGSLDAWAVGPKTMSSVIGTLGNDLAHTSILEH